MKLKIYIVKGQKNKIKPIYMKNISSLFTVLFIVAGLSAQVTQLPLTNNTIQEECGFDAVHQKMMLTDPVYKKKTEDFNLLLQKGYQNNKAGGTIYRVPVVVHVMHKGEAVGVGSNISEADINRGIRQVNERWRKVAGSLGDGGGVDLEIEFALAVRDPGGNCTNGIVRVDMSGNATYVANGLRRSTSGITEATLRAASRWSPTDYYNIYLVSEIDDNDCGFGIQGFAYFAGAHGGAVDGMYQLGCKFAQSGNTTLTHELGHAWNLYHTFQGDGGGGACPANGNCATDGDLCCDTPPHRRSGSDCIVAANACDGGSSSNLHIHNYMDYSSDACQNEFTADQETRASAAMVGTRASFLESNGNMSLVPPAAAGVDFDVSSTAVCLGNSVSFYDESTCIPNTYQNGAWTGISFLWTFDNGVNPPITSTLQNPSITFANAGSYSVTLAVTTGAGTSSSTKINYVVIAGTPAAAGCTPGTNNAGNFGQTVNNVSFNTISNSTSTAANVAYTDFICTANTVVTEGTTHQMDIDIRAGGSGQEVVEVYIDYNNDGNFAAGELVLSGSVAANNAGTITGNVVIPTNAVENTLLRMRVMGETGTLNNNERNCVSNYFIGDVEDYGVYIISACTTPVIAVTGSVNPTTCLATDGSITINGTGTGNVNWTGAASGSANGVALPYTITGLAGGSYNITYGVIGCTSAPVNAVLTAPGAPAAPTISASGPLTFCASSNVILTSSQASGNTWSTGATTQSITVSTSGPYTVTFTDGSGCSATSAVTTVTVNALPTAPTISASGPLIICAGGTVDLTSSQASSNTWSSGATTQTITVTATSSNTVTFTDGNGCESLPSAVTGVAISPSAVTVACTPASANNGSFGNTVSNVTFNTINNTTSTNVNAGYTDYTCTVNTILDAGNTYQMDVDLNAFNGTEVLEVYIDYNNDGSFAAGEMVLSGSVPTTGAGAGTITGNVVVPTNAAENVILRMRVIGETNSLTNAERNCASNMFIADVEDYGVFIISNPLPIELLYFEANAKNEKVFLNWQTATEINNDYFVLERSVSGTEWISLGKVKGSGNSNSFKSYKYIDDKPIFGTSYYRLKQVDFDGASSFSEVEPVNLRKNMEVKTYPNPFYDNLNFDIYANEIGEISVEVYNLLGSIVETRRIFLEEGNNTIQTNFGGLRQGTYIVKLSNGSKFQEHFKITKK